MDAVPWKFVNSVVELFGRETLERLARKVRHPLWKNVVDLHHRNRVYYEVRFRKLGGGIKHLFMNSNLVSMRTIQGKGRFARIVGVIDLTIDSNLSYWCKVESLGKAETTKLLETISPLIDPVSGSFSSYRGSPDCTRMLLTSLFKRVYLQKIRIPYCGKIAYDFLEDQINNSPFLAYIDLFNVEILRRNWPKSTLDRILFWNSGEILFKRKAWKACQCFYLLRKFTSYQQLRRESLKSLEGKRESQFCFPLYWRRSGRSTRFFKHDTEKSVTVFSNRSFLMSCYKCECDKFEKCQLKEIAFKYPELHDV
uniref:F-box domain-containing protein n=1 Tax=Steinernema glaseri TaxID=37863 RepID=A0A1I7YG05_9BILA